MFQNLGGESSTPAQTLFLRAPGCAGEPVSTETGSVVIKTRPGRNCGNESNRRVTGGSGSHGKVCPVSTHLLLTQETLSIYLAGTLPAPQEGELCLTFCKSPLSRQQRLRTQPGADGRHRVSVGQRAQVHYARRTRF